MPFLATCMDFDDNMLCEIHQTGKGKYCVVSLICGILKIKKEFIDTENRLVVARGERLGEGKIGEGGQRYKLQL